MKSDHTTIKKKGLTKTNQYRLATALTLMAAVVLIFQNCSEIAFTPTDFTDEPGVGLNAVPTHSYAGMTVGSSPIPDLKMVFIVDNSYTMTANQVNLSQSFANMLSQQNSTNLTPFNTTAYLFNTAQLSLPLSSSKLLTLSSLQFSKDDLIAKTMLADFSPITFLAEHRPNAPFEITGKIPGDSIGYNVKRLSAEKMDFIFEPMPVMDLLEDQDGFYFDGGVHKPANVTADAMVTDFQNRLSLLNSLRSSDDYPEISDSESGMCAIARILNRHDHYFKSGDIPAFVIVSDENEANLSGDRCVASYAAYTGYEDLVKGDCQERTTTITGTYNVVSPANCKLDYKTEYKVKYVYTTPTTKVNYYISTTETPKANISFYKTEGYEAPKTNISYYTTSKKYKRSSVQYYLTVCETRDGVVVEGTCQNIKQSAVVVDGDMTLTPQACIDAAKNQNPKALYGSAYSGSEQPVCLAVEPRVLSTTENCLATDTNCIINYLSNSTVVFGSYATADSCKTRAAQITGAYIDNSHLPTCTSATSLVVATGACPTAYPNCIQKVTATRFNKIVTDDGNYATNNTNCQNKAKTFTSDSSYVTAEYPAVCSAAASVFTYCNTADTTQTFCLRYNVLDGDGTADCAAFATAKKSNLSGIVLNNSTYAPTCVLAEAKSNVFYQQIPFSSAIISPLVAVNGSCTTDIINNFYALKPTLPKGGACLIDSYISSSTLILKNNLTCEDVRSNFAIANVNKYALVTLASEIAESTNLVTMSPTKTEKQKIDCNTQCSATSFCTPAPTGSTLTYVTNSTISDYLKSVYGQSFSCAVSGVNNNKVGTFAGVDISGLDINNIAQWNDKACPASSAGVKRYAVLDGTIYHKSGVRSAYVSGNGENDELPAKNLRQYIQDTSNELFGTGNAMVTTFVRQAQDGNGQGGSVGVDYEQLATDMGGQKYSVMSNDYSPALVKLSQIIKAKLDRSFVVPGLNSPLKIYTVWMKSGSGPWLVVDPALWSQGGSTLTLDNSVEVILGDRIKVEFY